MSYPKRDWIVEAAATESPERLRRMIHDLLLRYQSLIEKTSGSEDEEERRAAEIAKVQVAAKAIRSLTTLLPQAVQQARKGKPALLRMILRATK